VAYRWRARRSTNSSPQHHLWRAAVFRPGPEAQRRQQRQSSTSCSRSPWRASTRPSCGRRTWSMRTPTSSRWCACSRAQRTTNVLVTGLNRPASRRPGHLHQHRLQRAILDRAARWTSSPWASWPAPGGHRAPVRPAGRRHGAAAAPARAPLVVGRTLAGAGRARGAGPVQLSGQPLACSSRADRTCAQDMPALAQAAAQITRLISALQFRGGTRIG
jgi:hypothetical protein